MHIPDLYGPLTKGEPLTLAHLHRVCREQGTHVRGYWCRIFSAYTPSDLLNSVGQKRCMMPFIARLEDDLSENLGTLYMVHKQWRSVYT